MVQESTTGRHRFDNAWLTSVRIAVASSPSLANSRTAIISLVVLPILQLLLFVAIASAMGSSELVITAYAGVLVSAAVSIITGMVGLVSKDRQLGVLQDALAIKGFNFTYWLGKVTIPLLVGCVVTLMMLLGVFTLDAQHDTNTLVSALTMTPIALLVGALAGSCAGTVSVGFKDPYLVSNVLSLMIPVTAAVMAPLSVYPPWLAVIAHGMPLTGTIEAFRKGAEGSPIGDVAMSLLAELTVLTVWTGLALIAGKIVLRLIRSGKRNEDIW